MTGCCTLIFETSTPRASLAVVNDEGETRMEEFTGDRSHNSALFSPLQSLLSEVGAEQVSLVLVGSGPGSYSGTRVGIAAAQGVAIANQCPAIAIPSILAVPPADGGRNCLAIGDARRGSYWFAYTKDVASSAGPELTDLEGLEAAVSGALLDHIPVFSFEDPARFPLPPHLQSQITLESPDAVRLHQAWKSAPPPTRAIWQAAVPQPVYLKPPHITPAKRPWLQPSQSSE